MQIINALLLSTIAGLSTVIGSFIVFFKIKDTKNFISITLSFSATIMIGLSIFELFPISFIHLLNKYNFYIIIIIVFVIFILGKGSLKLVNILINNNSSNLYKIGIINMLILIIHNFPEGIITFITSLYDINIGIKISLAIMLHNIPEGIAIASPIYISSNNKIKAIYKSFISGISEPLGALFAYLFLPNNTDKYIIDILFIIVSIIMITISIDELLPEAFKNNKIRYCIYGIIGGIVVLLINVILL